MPGTIQVIPQGLLGFFQLKNGGRNPGTLTEVLSGTLDLRDWYFNSQREVWSTYTVSVASGITGFQSFTTPGALVVPDNEFWYVHNYTIFSNQLAAGDSFTGFAPAYRDVPGSATTFIVGDFQNASGVNTRPTAFAAQGFWLTPGQELGFWLQINTLALAKTVTSQLQITRLPN